MQLQSRRLAGDIARVGMPLDGDAVLLNTEIKMRRRGAFAFAQEVKPK